MKKLLIAIIVCIALFPMCAHAAAWKTAITAGLGYDRVTLQSGFDAAQSGNKAENLTPRTAAIQVRYSKWAWQPTIELSVKESKYDFSDETQYLVAWPREISVRAGITREVGPARLTLLPDILTTPPTP